MKSVMATLTVAVLVGVQPLSAQIGQEIAPPTGVVTPRPQPVVEPETPQAEDAPRTQERTHVVRRGDTLWDLAAHYYSNPYAWPTIHDANRSVVEDPHWIFPEEVLVIPGAPTAVAEGPPSDPGQITPVSLPTVPTQPAPQPNRRTRFYRTGEMQGDVLADEEVVHIAVQAAEQNAAPWIANPDRLPVIGAVLRTVDAPPNDEDQQLLVHPFDEVYIEYRGANRPSVGEQLLVIEVGEEIDDGRDEYVIRPAGVLTVVARDAATMTARVDQHWFGFNRGARVIPLYRFHTVTGLAQPIRGPLGVVRGFVTDQPLYSTADYGFLDLNQSQVRLGDGIMIYRTPDDDDTVLPPETVAFGKIVKVGPDGSTFRVTNVVERRLEPGLPAQVVSRIP